MPRQQTIELLRDKWKSYDIWRKAGIKVPENVLLNSPADLKAAFERFGSRIWIRETIGAAGKGSLSCPTFETALHHLDQSGAWGYAVAAEHLSRDTTTWQSIWCEGRLVVGQGRRRLNWAFGNRSQSGVTGLTGVGETVADPTLDSLAVRCILAADPRPHGIFSVDFTMDLRGEPNPTEINIAKFFTTHHFLTRAGCNMPEIFVQLAFGEYSGAYEIYNPCRSGMLWIRGIDINPVMIHKEEVEAKIAQYQSTLARLK
jgi:carbamoyl-phosphate synthase large subunit